MDTPPNIWSALGLPATFAPAPFLWHLAKLDGMTPTGPNVLHVIVIDTSAGTVGLAIAPDDLARFIRDLQEQQTGLTIAGPGDVPNGRAPAV